MVSGASRVVSEGIPVTGRRRGKVRWLMEIVKGRENEGGKGEEGTRGRRENEEGKGGEGTR